MKRILLTFVSLCLGMSCFTLQSVSADTGSKIKITKDQISGFSDSSFPLSNIVDGDTTTYWKSIKSNQGNNDNEKEERMYDHNRYITIKLDGTYNVNKIKINNVKDSFNNYYIYASEDGTNFNKVVSKTDDRIANEDGDIFTVDTKAAYIRLNMAYNSSSFETNLAELEVYGNKLSSGEVTPKEIEVSSWEGSSYQKEWDKFEADKNYANSKVIQETKNLVARVIGEKWVSKFRFELREDMGGKDVFEIENGSNYIIIRGNDGVSLASGFNYYLKNYAMIDYNPLFESNTNMKELIKVDKKIVKDTQYDIRYALNFCTYSYTMAFWGWDEYEEFIDWAAMNGVNLMLDIVGQEEVIRQTLKQYNYSDEEIKDYLAGPGYFAWFYMQNLYSFGGPLPDSWFEQRVELGRKMHDRMQAFGIDPVIQGFSGQVPLTFDDKNEGSVLTPIDGWSGFTRPAIIKTYLSDEEIAAGKKDYFKDMSKSFYEAQKNTFGDVSNYYAADPFHEGGNTSGLNITDIFKTVQTEMLKSNEDAIWVLQQWQGNLHHGNLSGLVKPEQALALDLQTDKNPSYGIMEEYDVPWVWSMLHNFGGRMGLDGEIDSIAKKPAETFASDGAAHMKGLAITPEALENSPVVYELLFDMTWSNDPINSDKWLNKYAERRAGGTSDSLQEAWEILHETAYSVKKDYFQGAAETVVNARPGMGFSSASTWGHSSIPYDKKELDKALKLLIDNYDAFKESPAYRYDLADVADQVLNNAAIEYHKLMVEAYNSGDSAEFKRVSTHFIELIDLSNKILGTNEEFMLGTWINDSRTMLEDADDWTKDLFEFNARALVTTWGGQRVSSLKDYSNRKWAGLTEDFYKERWSMWIQNRQADLDGTVKDPVAVKAESNWFLWEWQWANRKSDDGFAYETEPDYTDLKELAQTALDSYSTTSIDEFGEIVDGDINIAEGKIFETNPETLEVERKKLTDGTTGNEWIVNGNDEYVLTMDLEGTYQINSIEILLQQLAVDFVYNYKVEILNAETNEWQFVEKNADSDTMSSQTIVTLGKEVNKAADKVRITMKTRDAVARPLAITEIKVKGKALNVPTYFNVAKGIVAESSKETDGSSNIANITDDNTTSLWKTTWNSNTDSMYPAVVTLDLKDTYDVTSVELYLEKVDLPFKFKVVSIDENGVEKIILDKSDITTTLKEKFYKIPVNEAIQSVKVIYEGTTKQGPAAVASPAMTELRVLSLTPQKEPEVKVNHALNKPVTVSSINPYGKPDPKFINDGDVNTVWSYNGDVDKDSGNAEIDLEGSKYIDIINLKYKKESYDKYYKFDIYVYDANGTKTVVYSENDENVANQQSYSIQVNKKITKLGVDYKGKKAGTDGWFDIAELEAIGSFTTAPEIIFGTGPIGEVSTDTAYQNTVDGNKGTYCNQIKDKEIVFDLGKEYYVDHAIFTFEKEGLGLRYVVYSEDMQGNRTLVKDASSSMEILANRDVTINMKRPAKKIIFKHLGNNGGGSASLADPRLYEATFMKGTPENVLVGSTLNEQAASVLIDNDTNTSYTMNANQSVEFTLAKPKDVNILHVIMKNATRTKGTIVDAFKVERYDEEKDAWITIHDGSKNSTHTPEYVISLKESVFVNKIRLIALSDGLNIAEFKAYEADMTPPLVDYIQEVRNVLGSKRYDDNNGSYDPDMKEKIESILNATEDQIAAGMSSSEVEIAIAKIKTELNKFLKDGIIYINRSELLSNIEYAKIVLKIAKEDAISNDKIVLLENKLNEAKTLYGQYKATRTAIAACAIELKGAIAAVYNDLDVPSRYETEKLRAEELLKRTVGNKNGQVSQETYTRLDEALALAKADYASADTVKTTVIATLKQSIADFEANIVTVNKKLLVVALGSADGLMKADYDIITWNAFMNALKEAKAINDKDAVSQSEIDAAIKSIKEAKSALKRLNKSNLRKILDEISSLKEADYTAASWKNLMKFYKEGNTIWAESEVSQQQIDEMYKKVNDARKALVKKPSKPDKPSKPEKPEGGHEKPNKPSKPNGGNQGSNEGTNSGNVQTGDTSNNAVYMFIFIISLLGGVTIFIKKRQEKKS